MNYQTQPIVSAHVYGPGEQVPSFKQYPYPGMAGDLFQQKLREEAAAKEAVELAAKEEELRKAEAERECSAAELVRVQQEERIRQIVREEVATILKSNQVTQ